MYAGVPIKGWKRSVYEAATFDSEPEFHAAKLLDNDKSVEWWLRNDPVVLRIPTPAGYFEPDFIYAAAVKSARRMRILELKGEHLWNGPGSPARIKAESAAAWARAVHAAGIDPAWEFHAVLGQDAMGSQTLSAMLAEACERFEVPAAP